VESPAASCLRVGTVSRSGTPDLLPTAIVSTKPSHVGDETVPVA
jgi:hypothetical protein